MLLTITRTRVKCLSISIFSIALIKSTCLFDAFTIYYYQR